MKSTASWNKYGALLDVCRTSEVCPMKSQMFLF